VTAPEDVDEYRGAFARLRDAALGGDAAAAVLRRVAEDLRTP